MTSDEFTQWLSSRGAENPCPFCNTNEWVAEAQPISNDIDKEYMLPAHIHALGRAQNDLNKAQTRVHLMFMLWCRNCGFLRLHKVWGKDRDQKVEG